jgi:disulfide bond formation protein DsbB
MSKLHPYLILAVLGPATVLSAALLSQYIGGLHPCKMCIWQRWPHVIAIAFGLIGFWRGGRMGAACFAIAAITLLIGAGIGGFHAGVEQKWWEGPGTCTGGGLSGLSTTQAIDKIFAAPVTRCDEIAWSFLGLSMAAWNMIVSIIFGAAAAITARRIA